MFNTDKQINTNLIKQDQIYTFLYSGRKIINTEIGLYILDDDADGEGKYNSGLTTSKLSEGGEIIG